MSKSILDIVIRTLKQGDGGKQAAAELKGVKNTVADVSSSFFGFNAANLTLAGAIAAVGSYTIDATNQFVAYGEEIRGLTALTGTSAEETSRLRQAFDDMGISAEQFGSIVQSAAKKGFVFSLENVKALADEYNKLPTQVEKNALLQERLGKGASAAAKAFAEGSQAIETYYTAVSDGLALTDEEIQNADDLRRNIDQLKDSYEGFTLQIGGETARVINELIAGQEKLARYTEETGNKMDSTALMTEHAAIKNWELAESQKWVAENANLAKDMLGGYGDYAANQLPGQLKTAQDAQDEFKTALDKIATTFGDINAKMIWSKAAADLSAEGALNLARELGLVDETSYEAQAQIDKLQQQFAAGEITELEYIERLSNINGIINGLQSKDVTVRVDTYYNEHYDSTGKNIKPEQVTYDDIMDKGGYGEANGTDGWVKVPPGYPGDSYPVWMSSGEQYQVKNDRQRWAEGESGKGAAVTIQQVIIQNGMDLAQFEQFLVQVERKARRG